MLRFSRAIVCISVILFLSPSLSCAYNNEGEWIRRNRGPIPVRNQMPLYLFYLQMVPDKASVIDRNKFKINADYMVSSITVSAFTPATSLYDVQIDCEVSRVTLDFRYGIYSNLEVGLEVPYISLSSGYLDNLIEGIEDGIGARTPRSRERQGSYEFNYILRYNYKYLIYQKHSTDGIGDIVLNTKYQLLRDKGCLWPNLSLRLAFKFATADKDNLLGSGEYDYGAGLLLDKSFFDRLFFYCGANVAFIEKPNFLSELSIEKEIYSGIIALELFLTERFSIISQVTGNSTPYPYSDTNPLDNEAYDLGIGVNYTLKEKKDISFYFAIIENISAASSPDVSFQSGLNWRF